MALFDTVQDYNTEARRILQDFVAPYRYADVTLTSALNEAVQEARRLRPDLFLPDPTVIPFLVALTDSMTWLDVQYRQAFLLYIVGHCEAFDADPAQDARASAFLQGFIARLTAPLGPITPLGAPQ